MKQIWTGPVLNGHRERLLDLCSQRIAEGRADSFIYLCAARPLLDVVTLDLIERTENAAAWGPLPVYLFRLFVRRILAETVTKDGSAVSLRASIDSDDTPIRLNLVWLLLQELEREGKLEALGSFVGNEGCSVTVLQ